jgi:hypothetical protein
MRKGYLVVSNGLDGDEGLTAFRQQRRDSFAAMRDVRVNRRGKDNRISPWDDNKKANNDSGCSSHGGFSDLVATVFVWGGKYPGIEHGEIWWDDGEEEQEDADHLWDVKHVSALKKERQADQRNDRHADHDACKGLCPGFVVIGKHLGTAFRHALIATSASNVRSFSYDGQTHERLIRQCRPLRSRCLYLLR